MFWFCFASGWSVPGMKCIDGATSLTLRVSFEVNGKVQGKMPRRKGGMKGPRHEELISTKCEKTRH